MSLPILLLLLLLIGDGRRRRRGALTFSWWCPNGNSIKLNLLFVLCQLNNIWKMLSNSSLKRATATTTTLADNFYCCFPSSSSRQRGALTFRWCCLIPAKEGFGWCKGRADPARFGTVV